MSRVMTSLNMTENICLPNKYKCLRCYKFQGRKEEGGNILFNDALNTFYLRLYGVGHMVKDQPLR